MPKEIKSNKETIYEVQSYKVQFDMGNPVEVNINVYHEGQTLLSHEEIIDEALGYAEEVGIKVSERDAMIDTLQLEERKQWSDEEMIQLLTDLGYSLTASDGEISSYILADVAANSEGYKWDDIRDVWYK